MSKMIADKLMQQHQDYKLTFNTPEGKRVLADLKRFCRSDGLCADVNNVNATYLCEGRKEVWLRIGNFLSITDGDIYKLTDEADHGRDFNY
ncbi:MAG: hypothetical protein KZQ59_12215 [Candidatus Thiodiazotropha sp. (ex Lucinoma aequizonata)]|nr:hypothetical protein [Candidatus Thiodiazotropha sp. (ex Lucinoma aequizonata)]MCU7895116.1 hypothetical protein [Candidatus Thiodiazotropha sp. (ex Lucinoma aequizonata)]